MNPKTTIERAKEHFGKIIEEQLNRVEALKNSETRENWTDYKSLKPIVIGVIGGDGIGPYISRETRRVLEFLLRDAVESGKIRFKEISGLTIERRVEVGQTLPDAVLAEVKNCHVLLKGPTTTPTAKDGSWPNLESANVALRRELDLFANVRPVKVPEQGIDWVFFRENTEGAYILGSRGVNVSDDLAVDFKVATTQGSERIIRLAFDYAHRNEINRLTVVTKANILKATDGKFLGVADYVAARYPAVKWDSWFVDIFAAKLLDPKRRREFRVVVLPNLYGDIVTDEAAELQGGVGTAGSANIGKRYAMFEAIHGSAPRMVEEGRAEFANPSSLLRASVLLLRHIGFVAEAEKLETVLDFCSREKSRRKLVPSGRSDGATCTEFADFVMKTIPKI
ncbi:MAG: isocitrate/isopropylmalate family dehydrogenase [Methanophagales archaeon]|nr:isocitrate/isopropylmalate family dehydrogenase [Methanophagales archaeon]